MAIKLKTSGTKKAKLTQTPKQKVNRRGSGNGATKRTATRAKKASSTKGKTVASGERQRPAQRSGISDRDLKTWVNKLTKAGEKRDAKHAAYQEAVDEAFELIQEAMEAGVGTTVVSESVGVSRQNIYKGISVRERANGTKPKAKKAAAKSKAKPAAKAKAKAKTTGRKRLSIKKR